MNKKIDNLPHSFCLVYNFVAFSAPSHPPHQSASSLNQTYLKLSYLRAVFSIICCLFFCINDGTPPLHSSCTGFLLNSVRPE